MLVADGLGGLPIEPGGPTELEAARTPNLDALARRGVQGSMIPIKPGITPGSGPGHLGLFGYDPLKYLIGRGVLEATGIGFALGPNDVAIRCNFCTLDAQGNITDRRAGRIATEESGPLAIKLRQVQIPGVEMFVEPVKEHRFVVVFRGEGLGGNVADTDPQKTGVPPLDPVPADAASEQDGRSGPAVRAPGPEDPGRSAQGQRPDDAGLLAEARTSPATKRSTASGRPPSPSIRCTRAWPDWSA